MISVFTYGTLEIPEVMETVTGQSFTSFDATVHGFVRYLLQGKIYPGMTRDPGASTLGRVYVDMNERALTLLDKFEDEIYVRELLEINVHTGGSHKAFAYLIPQEIRELLSSEPWNKHEFLSMHFNLYIQSCRAFHEEVSRSLQ